MSKLILTAWDHHSRYAKDGKIDLELVRRRLGMAADAGITTLFTLPDRAGVLPFDPYLDVALELGLKVHVWIIPFASRELHDKLIKRLTDAEHWDGCKESFYPCVNDVSVREKILPEVEELIRKQGSRIDGIHLDYIRDDNAVGSVTCPCQCPACRALHLKYFGKEQLTEEERKAPAVIYKEFAWKNAFITDLVRKYRALTSKYGIKLSMAARANYAMQADLPKPPVYGLGPAVLEGQDWAAWGEEGLLDVISSMNYHIVPETFSEVLKGHVRLAKDMKSDFFTGIGLKSSLGVNPPDRVERYIQECVDCGMKGCTFFALDGAMDEHYSVIKKFA